MSKPIIYLEVISCLEEMEQAHPRGVHKGAVEWEEASPELDQVGIASALIVAQRFPIKGVHPAIA